MNSVLNNTFWFYLFSLLDFENRLKVKNNEFAEIIKEIDEKDYLDYDFLDSYGNYPKYPNDFRPIVNLNKYNILEIYNAYSSSNDFLLASINNENILNYKNTLDTIPITKISNDVRVQTIFFQDMYNGILETEQVINPFFSTSRDSYIFKQFGYQLPSSESNFSFIAAYALYQFLFTNMKSILDMYNKVQVYALPYTDAVNYTYQESLDKYIDSNLDILTKQISEFVLNYVYKITLPTGEFFNNVQEIVKKNIDGKLRTSIKNYLRNQDTMVLSNVKAISQGVYSKLSEILIQDLINYTEGSSISEVINEELNDHLVKVEVEKFNKRLSNYTENNFKPYSYLIFMYNRTPLKFLNVLQLVLKFYTEHEIKLIDDYDFTEIELRSYFNTINVARASLLERTEFYYSPIRTMGYAEFKGTNAEIDSRPLDITMGFRLYVQEYITNSDTNKEMIMNNVLNIVDAHIATGSISTTRLAEEIRESLSDTVQYVENLGINGDPELRILILNENMDECIPHLKQTLVLDESGDITVNRGITLEYVSIT